MIKEIFYGCVFTLIAAPIVLFVIFVFGYLVEKESCSRYGKVTNTKVYYDTFSGCYIKKGYSWYLLDSYRVQED